jgi:sterol desaturase/sphingolipid hydroxylase (fatty acid hydroxylase superfamily)
MNDTINSLATLQLLQNLGFSLLFGGFTITALIESRWPRHHWLARERLLHGAHNLALWLLGSVFLFWVVPVAHAFEDLATLYQIGLFRQFVLPWWLLGVLTYVVLDFADYLLHRIMHQTRWLWLIHMVHHADPKLDVSTNLRTHPLSYLLSIGMRVLLAFAFGAPLWAILLRDMVAVVCSHLHHAAIAWSPRAISFWQRYLEWLLISPTQHWRHHEPLAAHTNSNYGQTLSLWDRLFGTLSPAAVMPAPE